MEYAENAKQRIGQLKELQSLGLICADGDFVPSVHYPPITQYPAMSEGELYGTYAQPADGLMDIYVHFPFCERHCVFCHYPGKIGLQTEEKSRYIGYLKREIELYLSRFGMDRIAPRSVLVGGGTPTYLEPEALADFLEFFGRKTDMHRCAQFNYDVDPNTIVGEKGLERLRIMREMGVTRLTIGAQSLDDGVLRAMNRPHSAKTVEEAARNAKDFGFDLNVEFIYGHPGENYENWAEVVRRAAGLPADEIQFYRLKVLAYGDMQGDIIRKRGEAPSFEETMTMKQMAADIMGEHGFFENLRRVYTKDRKNISHYAYNQCCNLYDQVGFGITAFSSYRDRFALNTQHFAEYYESIDAGRLPMNRGYIRGAEQQLRWSIVLPLKNMDVKKAKFAQMNGIAFGRAFAAKVARLKKYGLLEETERAVRLTELGGFVADEVAEQFNSCEFLPFPMESYGDGPLNPYRDNAASDAFGWAAGGGGDGAASGGSAAGGGNAGGDGDVGNGGAAGGGAHEIAGAAGRVAGGNGGATGGGGRETGGAVGNGDMAVGNGGAAGGAKWRAGPAGAAQPKAGPAPAAKPGVPPGMSIDEAKRLLQARGAEQQDLFARARRARAEAFGDRLKVRGVVEISNICAKNCDYCAMRAQNAGLERYALDAGAILAAARQIMGAGISTVFLQSGQNPKNDETLCEAVAAIRAESGCEILLCAGERPKSAYEAFRAAGADSYILKFEAANPALYRSATHSDPQARLDCAERIRAAGMALGTGSIVGLPGQTLDDAAGDILLAISMKPDFASASPFIANKGTPFERMPAGDIDLTLNTLAIWRLAMPGALIPTVSALEYIHPDGQAAGLSAGANVITVNFTPKASRGKYAIYASDRFVVGLDHARRTAEKAGMGLALALESGAAI
jgi:oxygen-independent coproporphyrinogen-3 oxidase